MPPLDAQVREATALGAPAHPAIPATLATFPYGKFAHGLFRSAALLKWAIEKRQPSLLQAGDD